MMRTNSKLKLYLLIHKYFYGNENQHEETKELGIYSSIENINKAISRYKNLSGFNEYELDCFEIHEFIVDNYINIDKML